jgi:hypothetical protein
VLTFLAVILISPASVILAFPFGVTPQLWLVVWNTYDGLFVVLAIGLGVLGLGVSTHYKLEADRQRRKFDVTPHVPDYSSSS